MSFLTYLRRDLEQIFFKDRDPHAIPSMDGAFSPNDRLEQATTIGEPLPGADAVAEAAKSGFTAARVQREVNQRKHGQYKEEERSSSNQNPEHGAGTLVRHRESLAPGRRRSFRFLVSSF